MMEKNIDIFVKLNSMLIFNISQACNGVNDKRVLFVVMPEIKIQSTPWSGLRQ